MYYLLIMLMALPKDVSSACVDFLYALAQTVVRLFREGVLTAEDLLIVWCLWPGREMSQAEIAERLQRSEGWVSKRIAYIRDVLGQHGFAEFLSEPARHVTDVSPDE